MWFGFIKDCRGKPLEEHLYVSACNRCTPIINCINVYECFLSLKAEVHILLTLSFKVLLSASDKTYTVFSLASPQKPKYYV